MSCSALFSVPEGLPGGGWKQRLAGGGWVGAAFIHHPRQAPGAGGPQSAHLQPGSAGMIYLGQLVASPIGFICLLGASPLTDLHTLRFPGTQAWNPPPHIQAPTPTTSHPTSESTAPTLRSPAQTQYPGFPGISSNSEFPRQTRVPASLSSKSVSSQPSAPQCMAPPSTQATAS